MSKTETKAIPILTLIFSGITCCTVIVGAFISVRQFSETKKNDADTINSARASIAVQTAAAQSANQQLYAAKSAEFCDEATKDASKLAHEKQTWTPTSPPPLVAAFEELYDGNMGKYSDQNVQRAMTEIHACVSTTMYETSNPCNARLVDLSQNLAQACQAEIQKESQLSLPKSKGSTEIQGAH